MKDIQDWIYLLINRRGVDIKFCWVPSHIGIIGNERADAAAKAAARLNHTSGMSVPFHDFKSIIKFYCRDRWQAHWSGLNNNFKLKSIRPSVHPWVHCQMDRRSSVVLTRLRIGHSYLTHKYLMASGAERQVPQCAACHAELNVAHILVHCPFYDRQRRANLLANKSLVEILDESAPVEQIVKFLKDINLFYDI